MERQTPESLMISVILNTKDPDAVAALGVRPEHFSAYRDEYEWVNRYYREYQSIPTVEQLRSKFPGFRGDNEITDGRYPAKELSREFARKRLLRSISEATSDIELGDVETAYRRFSDLSLEEFTTTPENLLAAGTFLDDYDDKTPTIDFPWPTLQRKTGGFGLEQFGIFAARPSQGKSWALVKMAAEAAFAGYRVMFWSLEMSKRSLQVRTHAILGNKIGWGSQVNAFDMLHRRYSRDDYQLLLRELEEKTTGTLHIHDQANGKVTPSAIAARASEYDITFVDYIGLLSNDRGNSSIEDWRVAAEISNSLKNVAKAKKCRIFAAAQINRAGDVGENSPIPPKKKDLAQTDAYLQDADFLVTMTRMRGGHAAAYSLEKNRDGEDGARFYTKFIANQGDFTEITRAEAEDLCDELDD